MMKNKIGNARNWFVAISFLLGFGIVNIIGYALMFYTIQGFSNSSFWNPQMAAVAEKFLFAISLLDWVLVFVTLIFIIGVAVTSYRIASAPVYFIINFVMAAFYGYISYLFNYIFQSMVSLDFFDTFMSLFSKTNIILTNLHWVMLAMLVVGSIATYAKREKGQYVGGF